MKFVAGLYRRQMREGRLFLHEHPAGASSWMLKEIKELCEEDGVETVIGDQCMYGLKTWSMDGKEQVSARKRTRFMTNSRGIAQELNKKCDGSHVHQELISGRAKDAARYPRELCEAICRGMMEEMKIFLGIP